MCDDLLHARHTGDTRQRRQVVRDLDDKGRATASERWPITRRPRVPLMLAQLWTWKSLVKSRSLRKTSIFGGGYPPRTLQRTTDRMFSMTLISGRETLLLFPVPFRSSAMTTLSIEAVTNLCTLCIPFKWTENSF